MGRWQRTNALSDASRERRRRAELEWNLDRARRFGDASAIDGFRNGADIVLEKQSEQRPVSDWLANRSSCSTRRVHNQACVGRSGAETRRDRLLGRRDRREWNARRKADQRPRLPRANRIRRNSRRASPIAITPGCGARNELPCLSATAVSAHAD